eukprot:924598-Rhodomonas_salina.2
MYRVPPPLRAPAFDSAPRCDPKIRIPAARAGPPPRSRAVASEEGGRARSWTGDAQGSLVSGALGLAAYPLCTSGRTP